MRLRIATKLTLVVIPLVLLPLGGLAYVWYSSTKADLEFQAQEELEARLRQVGLRLKPFLRERELDLYDLASSPALRDYQTQLEYRLVQEADVALKKLAEHVEQFVKRREEFVAEARYLDESGRELVSATARGIKRGSTSFASAPFFQRTKKLGLEAGSHASIERSEWLQSAVLRLALPVYNEWREFRGVIVLDLPMSYFTDTLAGVLSGRSGTSFLVDGNGDVLGPTGASESLASQWTTPDELRAVLRTPPVGPQRIQLRDGGRGLLVREVVGAHGWSVGVLAPLAEAEGRVRALTQSTLAYGSVGAIILVLAVVLVARGASRRVRRLQAATAQLAEGNFGLRMPAEGTDEVGDLGRSFNMMAESLARRDAEVRARTEEAQRQRQELEVLNTVIQAAHTSLDLKESLEAILDRLLVLFDFTAGAIRLLDDPGDNLIMVAHRGLRPSYAANPLALRADEGDSGQTLRVGRPLVLNEPAQVARYQKRVPEGQEVGGVLLIPILSKGQPLGAVIMTGPRKLDFSEAVLHLLATIGLEVGTAIQNARLFSQTQALLAEAERHRARAEALAEIGRSVTATLDLDRVLDLVVERVSEAMGADAVSILRLDDGTLHYVRARGLSADRGTLLALNPGDDTASEAAALMRAPLWTADLPADPRFSGGRHVLALFNGEGIRAVLASPIVLGEEVWGILGICIRQPYKFSPEEVRFAGAVAQQAAIAIGNAKLYADLRAAYAKLEAAQEQAVQTAKLGALGQMAGGVAHDFNNLLAAILGRAELLQRRTADPLVLQGLKVIQGAALDGAETVRRILGFARAKGEEQAEPVEIATLLQQVTEIARPRWKDEAQSRGALINVALALEPVPPVRGNAAELREVFLNLLLNAVDAMPTGGTLTLGVRPLEEDGNGAVSREAVECFVRDTGVGMSPEVRRRAFDPFFTTKGSRGTGLGLSVVYGIVSRHGGRVRIDSRQNVGTTVTLQLPVFRGEPAAPAQEPGPVDTHSARILVVDDEEVLAEMLADVLRLEGGHVVEVLTDARVALDRVAASPPDLLFTDLGMPVLSGWELAAQARALHPGLPVVLVTGWGHQLDPDQVRTAGVVGVVAKPYRIEDIRKAVAGALAGVLQST